MTSPSTLDAFDWTRADLFNAVQGADDGEIFFEDSRGETLAWSMGQLRTTHSDSRSGFGVRVVAGEAVGFAFANKLDSRAIRSAAQAAAGAKHGYSGALNLSPARGNMRAYDDITPFDGTSTQAKAALLGEIDSHLRNLDPNIRDVTITLQAEHRDIRIVRPDDATYDDRRPFVRLTIGVVIERAGRRESATANLGLRAPYGALCSKDTWRPVAEDALRAALVNLEAVAAPSGEMDVVLGPGWPGMMLHEAVGHGLEADANRVGASVFAGRIGERVAAEGVTVIDDGTIYGRPGSINIDDEATSGQRTVLIEDGILKGYLHDRLNARLMGAVSTGSGRRQTFSHLPMPRMTNTFLAPSNASPEDILSRVQKGIYAVNFGGGQVDVTSGKFVFSCTEAYLVENGKIGAPVKGATIIGDGERCMRGVRMIGNDLRFDTGTGRCGKKGQSIHAGVGQPTILVSGLTVGGVQ